MFLFELDGGDPLSTKLIVLVNQLKSDVERGAIDPSSYTTEEFLDYLQDNGDIVLDVTDLYDMIKNPPLNTVIKNIQGDKVVFVGQEETKKKYDTSAGDDKKTVAAMAKRAMK